MHPSLCADGGKVCPGRQHSQKGLHLANPEKAAEHAAMRVRVHGFIDKAGAISITEIETIDRYKNGKREAT
jgi:hypothetical protein